MHIQNFHLLRSPRLDVNLICNTNTTVQQGGNCECRQDMKWNTK